MNCRIAVAFLFLSVVAIAAAEPGATPALEFSTLIGGRDYETPVDLAVDSLGNSYILGLTRSGDFPGITVLDEANETFVTKISPAGDRVVYTRLLPGCVGRGIAVNDAGEVIVVGSTDSQLFQVTSNAFQRAGLGGNDAFLVQLAANGSDLLYSTLLGGSGEDFAADVALGRNGLVSIAGFTTSGDLFRTNAAFSRASGDYDGFVMQFDLTTHQPVFSTYLGGSGADECFGVTMDSKGNTSVTGRTASSDFPLLDAIYSQPAGLSDCFVSQFSPAGALLFSTFFGGGSADSGSAITSDPEGNLIVFGITTSTDLPQKNAFQPPHPFEESLENFVLKISASSNAVVFASYVGGNLNEGNPGVLDSATDGIRVDSAGVGTDTNGFICVASSTGSGLSFPLLHSFKIDPENYSSDAYVAKISPNGELVYSTLLGGSGEDFGRALAVTPSGAVLISGVAGVARSPAEFPVTPGAYQTGLRGPFTNGFAGADLFLAKISENAPDVPANDNFANRSAMSGNRWTAIANNTLAASEPLEPMHGSHSGGKSVWWRWTAPGDGRVKLTTEGSSFETLLAAYSGNALESLQQLAFGAEQFAFAVTNGQSISIAVDGEDGASGTIVLSLEFSEPPNDDFANRIPLNGLSATISGSTENSTFEPAEAADRIYFGRSVWYSWHSETNGLMAVQVSRDSFRAFPLIFEGSSLSTLRFAAGSADGARAVFPARAGADYAIRVDGRDSESGPFELTMEPARPPENDNFANRTTLSGAVGRSASSNFDSTPESTDPNLVNLFGINYPRGSTVWWEWTAPTNGNAIVQATATNFDPMLAIFTGTNLMQLSPVAANGSAIGGRTAVIITNMVQGARYQILVDEAEWQNPGAIDLAVSVIKAPQFIRGARNATGLFTLTAEGVIGRRYSIQQSTNLLDWTDIAERTAADGTFHFDDNSPAVAMRYYRAIELSGGAE